MDNRVMPETMAFHLLGPKDAAQVDNDWTMHQVTQTRKIKRLKRPHSVA
jgi:hypothetical protein